MIHDEYYCHVENLDDFYDYEEEQDYDSDESIVGDFLGGVFVAILVDTMFWEY